MRAWARPLLPPPVAPGTRCCPRIASVASRRQPPPCDPLPVSHSVSAREAPQAPPRTCSPGPGALPCPRIPRARARGSSASSSPLPLVLPEAPPLRQAPPPTSWPAVAARCGRYIQDGALSHGITQVSSASAACAAVPAACRRCTLCSSGPSTRRRPPSSPSARGATGAGSRGGSGGRGGAQATPPQSPSLRPLLRRV